MFLRLRPNMAAINEYKKKEEVYMARVVELDAMTAARDEQKKHHDDLRLKVNSTGTVWKKE